MRVGAGVVANGRDPYFPAWPDVVQLNAFSPDLRRAVVATVRSIAAQCDGVRCDMAMLVTNDVFERTWGDRAGPRPDGDYWPTVIPAVKAEHPGFLFVAEAYWDLEWELQQQGFDHCYDKRLYDRLVHDGAEQIHGHLSADVGYQRRLVRFLENHDEPRAAATFPRDRARAAAVTTLAQTGMRLVHEGQLEGRKVQLPVFLARRPHEPVDPDVRAFYDTLLGALRDGVFRDGEWVLGERRGWEGNDTWQQLRRLGLARRRPQARGRESRRAPRERARHASLGGAPRTHMASRRRLRRSAYERSGDDLRDGLYVALAPWHWHLFDLTPLDEQNRG